MRNLVNLLHPRAPQGVIRHAKEWAAWWSRQNPAVRAEQPAAWFENLEPPEPQVIDFHRIQPVTEEDYLLKGAISRFGHTLSRGRDLFCIQEARILGPEGAIISPDNQLFCEFTYNRGNCHNNPVFTRRRIPKPKRLDGSYATLAYPLSSNYYHWVIESLPNIRSLEPYLSLIDGFFVPKVKQFHIDSLRAFGIERERIIELDTDSHYVCQRLYIPSFNSGWAPHRWMPEWMRETVLPKDLPGGGKKIFLSRKDSSWRKVTNEKEVMAMLEPLGFESIELTKLNFIEQARLFNSADTVISAHGAGLANIIFCMPGTRILEIHPPCWTSFCYVKLSDVVGCQYHYMIAEEMGLSAERISTNRSFMPHDHLGQADDMEIPLGKLHRLAESLPNLTT